MISPKSEIGTPRSNSNGGVTIPVVGPGMEVVQGKDEVFELIQMSNVSVKLNLNLKFQQIKFQIYFEFYF